MLRRGSILFLEALAAFAAGIAVLLAVAVWRLSSGPIVLDFLTPYIEDSLSSADGGIRVEVDTTLLTWAGWERTLDIRARGVRALAPDGATVAHMPELSLSLSARALLRGMVAPTRISLFRPQIRLVREAGGRIQLDLPARLGDGDGGPPPIVADLLASPDRARPMGYLVEVRILDADLLLDDQRLELSWHAPKADIILVRDEDGITGDLSLDIVVGDRRAHFDISANYVAASAVVDLKLVFADIEPGIFSQAPALARLANVAVPVSGSVQFTAGLDGEIGAVAFDIVGGAGSISVAGVLPEAMPIQEIRARGRIGAGLGRIDLDAVAIDFGGPTASLTATIGGVGGEMAVRADLVLEEAPLGFFIRPWPVELVPLVRKWIAANIDGGVVRRARVRLGLEVGAKLENVRISSLSGDMEFDRFAVHYLRPMPPLRDVAGRAEFTAGEFALTLREGHMRGMELDESTIVFSGLDRPVPELSVEGVIRGPVADAFVLIESEPLKFSSRFGITSGNAGGKSATRLVLRLPLRRNLSIDDVEIAAASRLQGASLKGAFREFDLTDADLVVQVDKIGLDLRGRARLADIPIGLTWTEDFRSGARFLSRYRLRGTLNAADRKRFGIDVAPYLSGPTSVDLAYSRGAGGRDHVAADIGLRDARMVFAKLGWSKPAGVAGRARIELDLVNDLAVSLPAFSVVAGDLNAAGHGRFDEATGRLRRLDIDRLVFAGNDLAGNLRIREDGVDDVSIRGARLDARPFFEDADAGEPAVFPAVRIELDVGSVQFGPEREIRDVSGRFTYDGTRWVQAALDGRVGEDQKVSLRLLPNGEKRKLTITASDAGATFKAINLYDNLIGGELLLVGDVDDDSTFTPSTGLMTMRDYRIVGAPVLARLLTVASLTGIVNLLSGEGIGFAHFEAPFRFRDDVIEIGDSRAFGTSIGLTMKGKIDLASDGVDLVGTIVPAYIINNLLGNIPILGQLLTGGKGSGVFAATYRMRGPLDNPEISVNPLSALAPGFLRNLLGDLISGDDEPSPESGTAPIKKPGPDK